MNSTSVTDASKSDASGRNDTEYHMPIATIHYTMAPGKNACGQNGPSTSRLPCVTCPYCRSALDACLEKLTIILVRLEIHPALQAALSDAMRGRQIDRNKLVSHLISKMTSELE